MKDRPEIHAGLLKDQLYRQDLDQNDRNFLFTSLSKFNGREEMLDYFLDYQGSWKLLMDNRRWADWKQERGFES